METQTGQAKGGGNLKASTGWVTTAFQPERGARPRRGVLRGGSFNNNWNNVRVANRNNNNPNNSNNNNGFRCAASPPGEFLIGQVRRVQGRGAVAEREESRSVPGWAAGKAVQPKKNWPCPVW